MYYFAYLRQSAPSSIFVVLSDNSPIILTQKKYVAGISDRLPAPPYHPLLRKDVREVLVLLG